MIGLAIGFILGLIVGLIVASFGLQPYIDDSFRSMSDDRNSRIGVVFRQNLGDGARNPFDSQE